MHFATPLVALSGCVGFGEEYTRVEGFSNADAGAVCLKGSDTLIADKVKTTEDAIMEIYRRLRPGDPPTP